MAGTTRAMVATNIWTARLIPLFMFGLMAYATYVIFKPLSIDYLISKHNNRGAAIAILVTYFFILLLMLVTFLRLLHITYTEPSYVPLGPAAIRDRNRNRNGSEKRHVRKSEKSDSIGGGEYAGDDSQLETPPMEMFYTKDVFVAEMDGKPKWCTHCANWKPDRAHHCSSSGRCITRMDHFCPWVGGPVGENNFKFFIQFTWYCALYCLHILVVMAVYLHKQRTTPNERLNPHLAVALGLSGFFGLFTAGMTATSFELAIRNQTQVERMGAESRIHILAVIKPPSFTVPPIQHQDGPVLSYPELTYPLGTTAPPSPLPKDTAVVPDQNRLYPSSSHTNNNVSSNEDETSSTRDLSTGSTLAAPETTHPTSIEPSQQSSQPQWPTPAISKRDQAASRTFLILKMPEAGYNPWDLGSSLLNWESVMGYSILDWLLPFKRSPCCNHEEDESYYQVGPMVDLLKARYGLIDEREMRAYGGRRREEKIDERDLPSVIERERSAGEDDVVDDGNNQSRRRRRGDTSKEDTSADHQPSVEMESVSPRTVVR